MYRGAEKAVVPRTPTLYRYTLPRHCRVQQSSPVRGRNTGGAMPNAINVMDSIYNTGR